MGSRVVLYSVGGALALGLVAVSAIKSRQTAPDSVAMTAPHVSSSVKTPAKATPPKSPRVLAKTAPAASTELAGPLPRDYRVLLTHSLFACRPVVQPGHATGPVDSQYTLCGVMQRGRAFVACIEDAASKQPKELRVGDPIGAGRLIAIDLEGVRYATQERNVRVEVGQSFSGARRVATAQTSDIATLRQITE